MTYVIAQPCVDLKDRRASRSARSTASTRASGCSTSTPTSASTAVPASRSARSRPSTTRTTPRRSGRTTTRPTCEFFDDLGSPGGAAKMGVIDKDHPIDRGAAAAEPRVTVPKVSDRLPDFPWDHADAVRRAGRARTRRRRRPVRRHPGRPDARGRPARRWPPRPTPRATRRRSGYGRPARGRLRLARAALRRDRPRTRTRVLPTIGSKELVAGLPTLPRASVPVTSSSIPSSPTRPTTSVRRWSGAETVATDALTALGPRRPALVWVNSPSNPTGRVLPRRAPAQDGRLVPASAAPWWSPTSATPELRLGGRARLGAAPRRLRWLASRASWPCTRCPSAPTWPATGAAFVAGDPAVVAELLAVRATLGLMMPGPAARHGRGARGRRPRGTSSARATPPAARPCAHGAGGSGLPDRPLRGRPLPVVLSRRAVLGTPSRGSPSAASWSRRVPSTGRPVSGTCASPSPRPTSGSPPRPSGCASPSLGPW